MMTDSSRTNLEKSSVKTTNISSSIIVVSNTHVTTANGNDDPYKSADGQSQVDNRKGGKLELKSAKKIFQDTFSVNKDKDENIKRASVSQATLKTLLTETADPLEMDFVEKLCSDAAQTDSELSCLTEIALAAIQCKDADKRNMLFNACVRIASGTWIHKHKGQIDLYDNIFGDSGKIENPIIYLEKNLAEKFNKRIASLSESDDDAKPESVIATTVDQKSDEKPKIKTSVKKNSLLRQQENLITLGILWLIQKNKIDTEYMVYYLVDHIKQASKKEVSIYEVSLYLAKQRLTPDTLLLKTLSMLREKINLLTENNNELKRKILQLEHDKFKADVKVAAQQQQIERLENESLQLKQEADQLTHQIREQELDARADRTHLRDDEKTVRAKAFNLMTEDVLEPLKLALVVLQREKPKVESAAYQIESAMDSIERELKWFKG